MLDLGCGSGASTRALPAAASAADAAIPATATAAATGR